MPVDANLLTPFTLTREMSEAERRGMAASLSAERFRSGAQVCREGDAGDCCWFLSEGRIAVSKSLPDGRKVRLAELPAGTLFGQSGLVPGQVRTAEVRAEGDVVLLRLPRTSLEWSLKRGDGWAVRVQMAVAVDLVRQLRTALGRMSELAQAEDPSLAAEGKTKDQIPQAQGLQFETRSRPAVPAPATPALASPAAEAAPASAPRRSAMNDLLSLMAETESALAGSGFRSEDVQFVYDEDQRRTAEARASVRPR